ncbi:dTDP-4-dehydrorhamnose reductase [Actinophytocola gossypii]|uniref:dTDP-4-dehydrorhamnose reductase n=1 Tax=Actinophytocola gossypii TaxID=2812003 RepID=A0ABT2JEA6_9PSEU|nr:dTDP-4-dehydrorhamnose reductase [Actinophytocola gossypii]MCT2586223.1 dTDP-4-dehydrorhamnose reductase [Actinophytocola gossypii]
MLALLVPGGNGQLGRELAARAPAGYEVRAPGSAELDITNAGAVIEAVKSLAEGAGSLVPVVVNTAAYTAVDAAETDTTRAFAVNADGPRLLAAACSAHGVPLVHVSTDYVFAGDADHPYAESDPPAPRGAYGATKAAGEEAVLGSGARAWVVRTAWVYGAHGRNFVKTMARLAASRDTLTVVDDQRGSPTWTGDLADGLLELAGRVAGDSPPESTILHATGGGETTWYEFAGAVFEELGLDPARVRPCKSEEYPTPAPRPAYSVLSDAAWRAAGLTPLRPWREALAAAFAVDGAAFRDPA